MDRLSAPKQEVGCGKQRHAEGDDPSGAVFVGQPSGEWSDECPGRADDSKGSGNARAEAVVAMEQKRQGRPEAAERGEDELMEA